MEGSLKTQITIRSEQELQGVAARLLAEFPGNRIFAFYGEMGAGKTTFIKAICRQLGVMDEVQSPSFAIIHEYNTIRHEPVFHFDFYRIKKPEEAYDIGYEDYLYSGYYCLIEWPEKIEHLLPENMIRVSITGADYRLIEF